MKKEEILQNKIFDLERLKRTLSLWRFQNKIIVFTNGCFDILHHGHISYLSEAADYGDKLIVGLNTDESVRRLKGNSRPIFGQNARAQLLSSIFFIDAVILFEEDTPYELISVIKPDVLVKGSDYQTENIVGQDIVIKNGGVVKTVELVEGVSSTRIFDRILHSGM